MKQVLIVVTFMLLLISGCTKPKEIEIVNFELFTNFSIPGDLLTLEMDLSDGPYGQMAIPSQNGKDGPRSFHFSFRVTTTAKTDSVAYKIYYQNESYKHPESIGSGKYNASSSENFYGSWISNANVGFKMAALNDAEAFITDSVLISGNPFNDPRYFGAPVTPPSISEEDIERVIEQIEINAEWYASIVEKAGLSKKTVAQQLEEDARWILRHQVAEGNENHRWKNNPRVGQYQFMVVAGTPAAMASLPDYIHDARLNHPHHGVRMNPFYYFLSGKGASHSEWAAATADQRLKTFAVLRPAAGFYYDLFDFSSRTEMHNNPICSSDSTAFYQAHFKQYLNTEYRSTPLQNVNYAADVGGAPFGRDDFERGRNNEPRIPESYVTRPAEPCINAYYNDSLNAIVLTNPGNAAPPYLKENAGTEGRIGFAYGKFSARIQFPEILSNDNVWSGITCAFWLKFHSQDDWNLRNVCTEAGYLDHNQSSKTDYLPSRSYSEIDIEIVKASRNWPLTSYKNPDTVTSYHPAQDYNLIVTCTNWDLACPEPRSYHSGVQEIQHTGKSFFPHRWDDWYPALTLKTERPAEQTVGSVLLYEIDWRPEEIIWRIGNHKETMNVVGYMNSEITKIPNNQMVPVVSQEFHYGEWWPTTPFPQGDIPYPLGSIEGYVYEIVIE